MPSETGFPEELFKRENSGMNNVHVLENSFPAGQSGAKPVEIIFKIDILKVMDDMNILEVMDNQVTFLSALRIKP